MTRRRGARLSSAHAEPGDSRLRLRREPNELTLTFATGRAYVYSLVPPAVFAAFEAAASKGAFHNAHIRDRYPFRKVKVAPASDRRRLREALRLAVGRTRLGQLQSAMLGEMAEVVVARDQRDVVVDAATGRSECRQACAELLGE